MTPTIAIMLYIALIPPCTAYAFGVAGVWIETHQGGDPVKMVKARRAQKNARLIAAAWPLTLWLLHIWAIVTMLEMMRRTRK